MNKRFIIKQNKGCADILYKNNVDEMIVVEGVILNYIQKRGKIVYMQYTHAGKLVTFDGEKYTVEDGGKFTTFRN